MSKFREKAQGRTKQVVGEMIGDRELVDEGREQERKAEKEAQRDHQDADQAPDRH
ncbi:hypothetical protein [Bradyrhizobium sp. NP1]|jgi:uncharacterized protein YjbJ (UPF0337 family)|uniref:hypothetical protein n=1 Tax=Bradyrhizobium sp. NP1 TaxID=3049772 RepID=UPI0025A670B3|nr:hypothetical protein [Bradyrhizobium sp. NP1]WJR80465.1 hypothetical protein QOU61_12125 [Bradyrhizobium sp. NP1]